MPGQSHFKCNSRVVCELWNILKQFAHTIRYFYYNELLLTSLYTHPILIDQTPLTLKDIINLNKKLIKNGKDKYNSKYLGKLSHNGHVQVYNEILKQVKSY